MVEVHVSDKKYAAILEDGPLRATRYGEPWRDLCGDKFVYSLAAELHELRQAALGVVNDQGGDEPPIHVLKRVLREQGVLPGGNQ